MWRGQISNIIFLPSSIHSLNWSFTLWWSALHKFHVLLWTRKCRDYYVAIVCLRWYFLVFTTDFHLSYFKVCTLWSLDPTGGSSVSLTKISFTINDWVIITIVHVSFFSITKFADSCSLYIGFAQWKLENVKRSAHMAVRTGGILGLCLSLSVCWF